MKNIFLFFAFAAVIFGQRNIEFPNLNANNMQAGPARSLDGSNNNANNPDFGQINTQLIRIAPQAYEDDVSEPRGGFNDSTLPSGRLISNVLFAVQNQLNGGVVNPISGDFIMNIATFFGQFQDHDFSLTPEAMPLIDFSILVPQGDPFFDPMGNGNETILADRFVFDPATSVPGIPREHINVITAYADLSNVYGVDTERNEALRADDGGLMNTTNNGLFLPRNDQLDSMGMPFENANPTQIVANDLVFFAGDIRVSENPALVVMHTLFVREHNRIVAEIDDGSSDDETLYQEARRRNIAVLQRILYSEWLPLMTGGLFPDFQYSITTVAQAFTEASTAAFRFGHTMLTNSIFRRNEDNGTIAQGDLMLQNGFFGNPEDQVILIDIDPYLNGLIRQVQNAIDNFAVDAVRNFLFGMPGAGGLDLIAINIQRGRELGIPAYNGVRTAYGLATVANLNAINPDTDVQNRLAMAYPDGIMECDIWACSLAEPQFIDASNNIFSQTGETFRTIIRRNFQDLRDGDSFFYLNNQFPDAELDVIENTRMADVVLRNTQISRAQCQIFASADGCAIGGDRLDAPEGVMVASTGDVDFVFDWVEKTEAHTFSDMGDRFGYTVSSDNNQLTQGGEGAPCFVLPNTAYTFASNAGCNSRLFVTDSNSNGEGGLADSPATDGGSCIGRSFTWTTPSSSGATHYYASSIQTFAGGPINVVDELPNSAGVLVASFSSVVALLALFFA